MCGVGENIVSLNANIPIRSIQLCVCVGGGLIVSLNANI